MAQYKDGNYIVKDGEIYEVQIDIPRMMGAEVIHIALKDFKKQTNADRIRSMTDEELAKKMSGLESFALTCGGGWPPEKWLDWLRKEANE